MSTTRPKRRKLPHNDGDDLALFALQFWRKWSKQPGSKDRLQTREFRRVAALVSELQGVPVDFDDPTKGREWLGAYILYKWQIHYQQGLSLLSEIPRSPQSVLDICSGPGAFALAAFRHGAENVQCLDRSPTALRAGAELCGYSGYAPRWNVWTGPRQPLPNERFDCIIVGHALEELFPVKELSEATEAIERFCHSLAQRLAPDGHLLLVESSFPETNRWFLTLRDRLVHSGFSVRAPCIWQGACPALEAKAPCYAQRQMVKAHLVAELQRAARINAGSLKMSYLLLQPPPSSPPQLRRSSSSEKFYRVISPPFESHLGPRIYLCGDDGKRDLGCSLKCESDHRVATFRTLQRGGLYRIANAHERGSHLEIVDTTEFTLAAPPGKPLPENG